jgi:2-keto-4-pentenoate hydratase
MKNQMRVRTLLMALSLGVPSITSADDDPTVIQLWPGKPPGETRVQGEMKILEGRPRPFFQYENVSEPIVTVLQPPEGNRHGTGILVCPGGGLQRLAYEHEGLEVSKWLNAHGITAFLLRYRVPAPIQTATMDAQRAMSIVRSRAGEWGVEPDSIGMMGFSAGGEIGAWLVTHASERQYEKVDELDDVSSRPDFAALIYSGGLVTWRSGELKEEIASRLGNNLPPIFMAHAFDDASQNSLALAMALKRARVPTELHLYHAGGHGFGARNTGLPAGSWKERFTDWLSTLGYLDPAFTRAHASEFFAALQAIGRLPRFSERYPDSSMDDAYTAQRRLVRQLLHGDEIGGFKGAGASAAAQRSLNIDGPMTGVLLKSGRLEAGEGLVIDLRDAPDTVVETELGFTVAVDISYEILNDQQMQDAVAAVFPVIELPENYTERMGGTSAKDMVASNIGSHQFIVGEEHSPQDLDVNALAIRLGRDGETLHETTGGSANGGQWANLRSIMNQITGQGYVIRSGTMIISGALGQVHPGESGKYRADYGKLGLIEFELK